MFVQHTENTSLKDKLEKTILQFTEDYATCSSNILCTKLFRLRKEFQKDLRSVFSSMIFKRELSHSGLDTK